METCDALIVGGGHNGLAAAVMLADEGWDVIVVEANDDPGGAVRTVELTEPGFRHDVFAGNLNLFAGSPFRAEFGERLERHGLSFTPNSRAFSSVFPDGSWVGVTSDATETHGLIAALSESDAAAFAELHARFGKIAPHIYSILGAPMPSRAAAGAVMEGRRRLGPLWPHELARLCLQSSRELAEEAFERRELHAMLAAWGMHLAQGPDVAGGGLIGFLETFGSASEGQVLGTGGARVVVDSMVSLLGSLGGRVETGSPAVEITVAGGVATGAILADGRRFRARRAVIGNLGPRQLFHDLTRSNALSESFLRKATRFRQAPGTMMIHLALDDLPPWRASAELRRFNYVHVAGYLSDMSVALAHAEDGLLPARPTLVVGQPTVSDPSRAPAGKHILWVMVRVVPSVIRGDALGEIDETEWEAAREPYADRLLGLLEEEAPGLGKLVRARTVLAPPDIEGMNANLVGGDLTGGSSTPMQSFFLRPFPGWSRYETPIDRLFMCGAATSPGSGVHAISGFLLAKQLLARSRRIRGRLGRT